MTETTQQGPSAGEPKDSSLRDAKSVVVSVTPSLSEEAMVVWGKVDLTKDQRAEQLAKIALGWDDMTTEQKMDNYKALIQRATQIKETL